MATKRPEVLLLVGMSGAGRSASSNVFEDLGYYVIENLPPDLVESVVESNDVAESNRQLVLTVDARDGFAQDELNKSLNRLSQSGVLTRVIFLDADTETLIRHYDKTLESWLKRFLYKKNIAKDLFDEKFCRMWEMYLAGCSAAFKYRDLVVFQYQLVKNFDAIPSNRRDYIYS